MKFELYHESYGRIERRNLFSVIITHFDTHKVIKLWLKMDFLDTNHQRNKKKNSEILKFI